MQNSVLQQSKSQKPGVTDFSERWGAELLALAAHWMLCSMARTLGVASTDLAGVVSEAAEFLWVPVHTPMSLFLIASVAQSISVLLLPKSCPRAPFVLCWTFSLGSPPAVLGLNQAQEAFVISGLYEVWVGMHLGCS